TGGSRGIGAAISETLALQGLRVFINYSRNEELAKTLQTKIQQIGGEAHLAPFDVTKPDEIDSAIEQITSKYGPLQVLINNAGITVDGLLMRMKNEGLDRTLDVDLKGAIYCARAAIKTMMKARDGVIVNISSVVGEMGNAGQSAYAAAKAGLIGFS